MPPKYLSKSRNKNHGRKKVKLNPLADCVFPDDIMMYILLRLPVKSLLRFRAVCKPWLELFATPNFVRAHHRHFSDDSKTHITCGPPQHLILHTVSLFKPTDLPPIFFRMNVVGCCSGLICLGLLPHGQLILLWNPATKRYKFLPLSNVNFGDPVMVSLGFGYDEMRHDFKVVRIVYSKGEKIRVGMEVYSSQSDSWETIKLDFQFHLFTTRNNATVNGFPFWLAKIDEVGSGINNLVMVWFDSREMVLKKLSLASLGVKAESHKNLEPLDSFKIEQGMQMQLVDEKESVWVYDNGPVELKVNEKMMIEFWLDDKKFMFDQDGGWVKEIEMEDGEVGSNTVHGYSESLTCVEGMKPVGDGDAIRRRRRSRLH